jgi:natural product biosynthesis luciferase-like monooxygenase protein
MNDFSPPERPATSLTHADLLTLAPAARQQRLTDYLREQVARVLQIAPSRIDVQQPVSVLGLDSLMAIEVQHSIEADLALILPIASLLEGASIARLAAQIEAAQAQPPAPAPAAPPILDRAAAYPLSYGQRALWFLHQLAPEGAAYNIASAVRIRAALDLPALRRAFQALVDRHAALRTSFPTAHGEPLQQVQPHSAVAFVVEDAAQWERAFLDERMAEEAQRPFDLMRGPLLRVYVFVRSPQEHILLLTVHHIIADFWSLAVLAHELGLLYRAEASGTPAALPPLPLQYVDYINTQTALLAGPAGQRLWDYWRQQLAGELPALNVFADRPRPPVQSYRGASRTLPLGAELTQRLKALSRARGASLYVTLLAAFQTLLHRYTGQTDILVGSPTLGRSSAQLAGLVGYFVNPVVLRANFSRNLPFPALLAQVRRSVLAALAHQEYPLALLAERLQPERDPSRSPLFQAMFIMQQAPPFGPAALAAFALGDSAARMELAGLPLESVALPQRTSQFDLTLTLAELDGALRAVLHYTSDLFDAATMSRLLRHFLSLLEAIAAQPERTVAELPLLTAAERAQLVAWNATATAYPQDACIHDLFAAQVARTPDAVALVYADAQVSYRELDTRANRLAHKLRGLGVGPDVRVGVCVERSPELLVGLLGVLKAGGAYVPLDPSYPHERLAFMLADSQAQVLVLALQDDGRRAEDDGADASFGVRRSSFGARQVVDLRADWPLIAHAPADAPAASTSPAHLAYVIYTSGSTGTPKGVMIAHRNVVNCFAGMDQRVGCTAADRLLALTSISFDISVLELFWTLTRGACLVLLDEQAISRTTSAPAPPRTTKPLQLSLFYFASADAHAPTSADTYRLVFEGAAFADRNGFAAVWTPERHFHAFGGHYPNPSVMSAALAMVTERVQLRAGSVVLPLHSPIRVAEEWALVDNLSHGRVGIAFASGWHADDFAFFPAHYADRKNVMFAGIETVQRLWRGEAVTVRGGAGNEIAVRILPRPIQPELPIWITAAGQPETFVRAGAIGANVLTHLLGQTLDEVEQRIRLYRAARAQHGHDPQTGRVTLMLHTFIGTDRDAVREQVRVPFTNYLRSSVGLIENMIKSLALPLDLKTMNPADLDDLLAFAFDRYFETSALFGTPATCLPLLERLKEIGVDEVACLIDFGVDVDAVLGSLPHLNALRLLANTSAPAEDAGLPAQAQGQRATLMQCTPSLMRMLALSPDALAALRSLRALLLGGEALPPALAAQVTHALPAAVSNMYGPTETTIWSATHALDATGAVAIGHPIANTQLYVLDRYRQAVPVGVAGELFIGGDGLARGYLMRPDLTAERFVPNPFLATDDEGRTTNDETAARPFVVRPSSFVRLYRTGDRARYRPDGTLEFLGRVDQQVKLRGFRIELGEIETVLGQHPALRAAAVVAWADAPGNTRLVAYVVPTEDERQTTNDEAAQSSSVVRRSSLVSELRAFLAERLPDYMIPAAFVRLDALPLTANGKIDRRALPVPEGLQRSVSAEYIAPRNKLEQVIAGVWQQALKLDHVGVNDNFFDLGGHSLLMAQVHSQLRELLQRDLPLIKLLEHPTISALGKYLSHERGEQPSFQQSQDRAKKQKESREHQRRAQTRYKPG